MSEWGTRIKERREAKKMSLTDFAKKVRVSVPTASDWEKGVIKNIEGHNLVRVASVLDTSCTMIMAGRNSSKDQTVPKDLSEDSQMALPKRTQQLVDAFHRLTPNVQKHLLEVALALAMPGSPEYLQTEHKFQKLNKERDAAKTKKGAD
ncbi:MAG: helix-turn-helix transcriptional regulator [Gammaproteobacteria bacterium]|nr:helix-turn-helix transcriptional regulator [Gammaproteobacteria bacterium]